MVKTNLQNSPSPIASNSFHYQNYEVFISLLTALGWKRVILQRRREKRKRKINNSMTAFQVGNGEIEDKKVLKKRRKERVATRDGKS